MSEELLTTTFVQLRKRFLRQVRHIFPSQEDAEDALQDAFVRLWPKAGQWQTSDEVEAVASVTLRHLGIDRWRERQKSQAVSLDDALAREVAATDEDNDAHERLAAAEAMMQRLLTPVQLDIIRLREYEDRTYDEISALLDMQPTAVRMQLSRARKLLRQAWHQSHEQ